MPAQTEHRFPPGLSAPDAAGSSGGPALQAAIDRP